MSGVKVVIQSRLLSARLPAKALLPIGGLPCVVLCAKRAANTGLDVVVATSEHPSDDAIAATTTDHCIRHVRGSEDDVLARFLTALEGEPPDTTVVRLTADNVVPDGAFIEQVLSYFDQGSFTYLGTHSPMDGLPYGLSVEVFKLSSLLEAAANTKAGPDREHVTPYMRRKAGTTVFGAEQLGLPDLSYLRCTVDSIDDYLKMRDVMNVQNPVDVPWRELVKRLENHATSSKFRVPFRAEGGEVRSRFTLGTVQLGLAYGRANTIGLPALEDAKVLVRTAVEHGVSTIDTARAYGASETRLGQILTGSYADRAKVYTKLAPLDESAGLTPQTAGTFVEASILRSLHELRRRTLDCVMLHRWSDYSRADGKIWQALKDFKDSGVISKLGSSVYSVEEAVEAMGDPYVQHLQIPYNILDSRWEAGEFQRVRSERSDVTVHVRSVYLQGLLVSSPELWPVGTDSSNLVQVLENLVVELGRDGRADLCLAYVNAQPWVDSLVVGCETIEQLMANLQLFRKPALTPDEVLHVRNSIPEINPMLLDPRLWPKT